MKKIKFAVLPVIFCLSVFAFFGCGLISFDECDHDYKLIESVEPTCTMGGYDVYECTKCGKQYDGNYKEKLPHTYDIGDVRYNAPTCEDKGYRYRMCTACSYEDVIEYEDALGHDLAVTVGYAPTCERSGRTDKEICKRCAKTIREQTEIAPLGHDRVVKVQGRAATCTDTGITDLVECSRCGTVLQTQTIIPIAHSDGNADSFCDICHTLLGSDVVDISTESQLKNISYNLGGKYRLVSDIVLSSGWTAIGAKDTPFTGKFDGNGHTVSGLNTSGDVAGVFGYSNGNIENLNIRDFGFCESRSRSAWDYSSLNDLNYSKESIIAGAVCAVNGGTVKNCKILGETRISCSASFTLGVKNPFPTGSASYEFCVGGIVGVNRGTVENCEVGGTAALSMTNTAEYYVDRGFFTGMQLGAGYKNFYNRIKLSAGWLVGSNAGSVRNSAVSARCAYGINVNIVQDGFGHSHAETVVDLGSAVGNNSGNIEQITAPALSVEPVVNTKVTPPWSGKRGEYCDVYNDMTLNVGSNLYGVIGSNALGGTCSGIRN